MDIKNTDRSLNAPSAPAGDRRRRLLIYALNYAPELTGCGRYTGDLGTYLAERGHMVEVVTAPPHYPGWAVLGGHRNGYSTSIDPLGVRISRCPLLLRRHMSGFWRALTPLSFALSSAPVLFWRILRARPELVFLVEPTLFAAPVALAAARLVGARTLLHVQDLEVDAAFGVGHLKGWLVRRTAQWFERTILRRLDAIVTISGAMRRQLEAKGVAPDRVRVIRNWVDLDHIRPLDRPSRFRAELGIPPDQFVVLYAGNIGPKQALHHVLDAARLLSGDPRFTFVIAGEGPAKPALMAQGVPNLRFLPVQPEHRLNELLNLADVHVLPQDPGAADLVLPSKLGGMLASGRPSVVMADPGSELAVFLTDAAHLVPTGDPSALAAALRMVASGGDTDTLVGARALARELAAGPTLALFEQMVFGVEEQKVGLRCAA